MAFPKVKLSDDSGNAVGVTDNRLNVNVAGATMSTGDIDIDSEFPAAATIADNFSNPDTTSVMSMGMVYDGSAWDMLRGTSADGVLVNLGSNNDISGTVTANAGSGTLAVSLASVPSHAVTNGGTFIVQEDGAALTALQLIDDTVATLGTTTFSETSTKATVIGAVRNDTPGTLIDTDNEIAPFQVNSTGALYINGIVSLDTSTGATEAFNVASGAASSSQRGIIPLIKMNDAVSAPSGHVDNDWTYFQTNIKGALYTTGGEVEDSAVQSQPLLIGGRYDSSDRDLDNGDAGAIALDVAGNIRVAPPSGSEFQVDVVAALPAGTNVIGNVGHDITGGADGVKTVSSAGTDVVLGLSTTVKKVDIQAQTDNTGLIAVGFTGVDATEATGTGVILRAGDTYSLEISNLNLIYIDSTVSGEGVRFTYFT